MINPQLIDELARGLQSLIPRDAQKLKDDMEHNLRALLRSSLERMDLVSREELDRQTQMLERYRQKLTELETRIAELEARDSKNTPAQGT